MCDTIATNKSLDNEEMKMFSKSALSAVQFKIIYEKEDLEIAASKENGFKPAMAHQIFGDNEMIFGYKNLKITLNYLHNSARCFVDIEYTDKIDTKKNSTTPEPDNIMTLLSDWLPDNYRTEKPEFLEDLRQEDHQKIHGEVLTTFEINNNTFKITKCDANEAEFRQFHERFETFMVWFIDGANFIDLNDGNWMFFYVYEERVDSKTQQIYSTPIGFCTVYKFYHYPNLIRTRISQFLILPTHQRLGIGTKFYSTIFDYLRNLEIVADITVEEPTEVFRKIRDFSDLRLIYEDFRKESIKVNTTNQKRLYELLKARKICQKQARKIIDMLEYFDAKQKGSNEYSRFKAKLKKRIEDEMTKELRGSKRICNMERVGVALETENSKERVIEEYNRYIDSFQSPINRLRSYLNQ